MGYMNYSERTFSDPDPDPEVIREGAVIPTLRKGAWGGLQKIFFGLKIRGARPPGSVTDSDDTMKSQWRLVEGYEITEVSGTVTGRIFFISHKVSMSQVGSLRYHEGQTLTTRDCIGP